MSDGRVPEVTAVRSPPRESLEYDQLKNDRIHIGTGGQGAVYRVNVSSQSLPEQIAVKEPEVDSKTVAIDDMEALLDEADTWETLDRRERQKPRWNDSEYIVGIIDIGDENFPWIAMEYMDGGGLDSRLEAYPNGGPANTALWIGECICQGVEVAHNYGIAHLDLKPSNILFRKTGEHMWDIPKIADWGLSRVLTEQTGAMEKLSVQYAAPEQVEPEEFGEPDMLTDVYQVGVLTYAMLTGDPPYAGKQASVLHDIVSTDTPTPPSEIRGDLPAAIDEVVLKALEKQKNNRYRNIADFEKALRGIRTKQPSSKRVSQPADSTEDNSTVDERSKDHTEATLNSSSATESTNKTNSDRATDSNSNQNNTQQSNTHSTYNSILRQKIFEYRGISFDVYKFFVFSFLYFITLISIPWLTWSLSFLPPIIGATAVGWSRLSYRIAIAVNLGSYLSFLMANIMTGNFTNISDALVVYVFIFIPPLILFWMVKKIK